MKWVLPLLVVVISITLTQPTPAHASLILNIKGFDGSGVVDDTFDATNGISNVLGYAESDGVYNLPGFNQYYNPLSVTLTSSFNLAVSLSDGSRPLAGGDLTGPISYFLFRGVNDINYSGGADGNATLTNFQIAAGVEPAMVPLWFPEMGVRISGFPYDGVENGFQLFLNLKPGTSAVPEPSSALLVMVAGLSALGYRWCRREVNPVKA